MTARDGPPTPGVTQKPISSVRLWLERIGIALVAVVSLLIPIVIGLLFYLAVTDGLAINSGDPLHEMRLWMVQERKGATGLGLTITSPRASSAANSAGDAVCAHTSVTFLKWDRSLRLENEAGYCLCYENRDNKLVETDKATCQ